MFPDVLLVDGGIGQLRRAMEAFEKLKITPPLVLSLAKKEELVYVHGVEEPVRLKRNHTGLKLLQYIRDEAHRFAQHYHHILRRKAQLEEDVKQGRRPPRKAKKKVPPASSIEAELLKVPGEAGEGVVDAPAGAAVELREHAERIEGTVDLGFGALLDAAIGAHFPSRTVAGQRILLVARYGVGIHAGEEIVVLVVLTHVIQAEVPVLTLIVATLGRTMRALVLTPGPFAIDHGVARLHFRLLAFRLDPDGVEEL
jgi:hypothetical protein